MQFIDKTNINILSNQRRKFQYFVLLFSNLFKEKPSEASLSFRQNYLF